MALWSKEKIDEELQLQHEHFRETLKGGYMKTQAEIARQQMNNIGMSNSMAYQNAAGSAGGHWASSSITNSSVVGTATPSAERRPRFDPNKHPATQMALSALVDLWRAKYGDTWVDCMAPVEEGDTFWPAGSARLERNGKLEKYDDGSTWLRIKEDA